MKDAINLHGRPYQLPSQTVVVVCVDGSDPEYLQTGMANGILPIITSWVEDAFHTTAKCVLPSLADRSNLSISTSAPTSVHEISGNYCLDNDTGEEIMALDGSTMRSGSTILEQLVDDGIRVAAITVTYDGLLEQDLPPLRSKAVRPEPPAGEPNLEELRRTRSCSQQLAGGS